MTALQLSTSLKRGTWWRSRGDSATSSRDESESLGRSLDDLTSGTVTVAVTCSACCVQSLAVTCSLHCTVVVYTLHFALCCLASARRAPLPLPLALALALALQRNGPCTGVGV